MTSINGVLATLTRDVSYTCHRRQFETIEDVNSCGQPRGRVVKIGKCYYGQRISQIRLCVRAEQVKAETTSTVLKRVVCHENAIDQAIE